MQSQNIFITNLEAPLKSWVSAFHDAKVLSSPTPADLDLAKDSIFWLHVNPEQQIWLQETIAMLMQRFPSARVAVLANIPNNEEAMFVLSLGALAYGHAYVSEKTLQEMRTVMLNGGVWIGNDLLKALISASVSAVNVSSEKQDDVLQALTKREREVALQAGKGLSNKEIARELAITERTVKAHLSSIFETLGVKDRLYLALVLNRHASADAEHNVTEATPLEPNEAPKREKVLVGKHHSYTYNVVTH